MKDKKELPLQKKKFTGKNKQWREDCIDAIEHIAMERDEKIRESIHNKQINYDLYNGMVNPSDMEASFNPMGIQDAKFPSQPRNYQSAIIPKFNLLIGEERKRRFNWFLKASNYDSISFKEDIKRKKVLELITQSLLQEAYDPEDVQNRLGEISQYTDYSLKDLRELVGTRTLKYLWNKLDLKEVFNQGYKDVLIAGEEIYCTEIIAGEPILRKCDPLSVYTIGGGDSHRIEDADIVLEVRYLSVGQIIDKYYEHLSNTDMDILEKEYQKASNTTSLKLMERPDDWHKIVDIENPNDIIILSNGIGGPHAQTDQHGNKRVIRTVWRSRRLVYRLKYFDPTTGEVQFRIVDENYKPNKELGEEVTPLWPNEWWEGGKITIGEKEIYLPIKPREVQFRSSSNISTGGSGYTGTYYATNTSKAISLMDRVKPYVYLYNIYHRKIEHLIVISKGAISEIDLAKIPKGWEVEEYLHFFINLGIKLKDSFKEGDKGMAIGKLSGSFSNTADQTQNVEAGNIIQHTMAMLGFIKQEIADITGVSDQRQGQIENRETFRGVERSITQSSHITEEWFAIHENTKRRALTALLETAKIAWKNEKSKVISYVTGDHKTHIYDIDTETLNESEYDMFVLSGERENEIMQNLKQLSEVMLQSDKANASQIAAILQSDSTMEVTRALERLEKEKAQRDKQALEQQREIEQTKLNAEAEEKQRERDHDLVKIQKETEKELLIKNIDIQTLLLNDPENSKKEIEKIKEEAKRIVEEMKIEHEKSENEKDRIHESKENNKNRKSQEKIASKKQTTTK
jgi:hypothetical protein